ncbi:hypothetical protein BKA63DRAFT_433265 [Paraphoma chrysanthemicola]|nr:hypothetical protein BKA63DRAFT_433265 [Paraphoma chrysanthemicola]
MAPFSNGALLLQVYHHTVLPRDVPGREDRSLYQAESEIARRLTEAVKSLAQHAPLNDLSAVDTIRLAIATSSSINIDGKIEQSMLLRELRQLSETQALILHVTEQNAALLIYHHVSGSGAKSVVFEAFEASATSEQVLATEDALEWDFPGQAVAIPYKVFSGEDFQHSLSKFLQQASLESIKEFSAVTYKACAPLPEIRDTPHPTLITRVLMTILEVNGSIHDTTLLRKRVRDTVSFYKAHKPWRRSALYLVLRVAVQRHLYQLLGVDKGRMYFKIIMCIFLSNMLHDGIHVLQDEALHALRQKIGRRLAKLELDQERGTKEAKFVHRQVFRTLRSIMENAQMLHVAMYSNFRHAYSETRSPAELLGQYENTTTLKPFIAVLNCYLPLCAYEEEVKSVIAHQENQSHRAACVQLARQIQAYISAVQDAYFDYPELKSRQLLNVMGLWMAMDKHALRCYPLLADFHPGFDAAILDVLQLSSYDELRHLHELQVYIARRCSVWNGTGSKTIFDTPTDDSFAVRYYDESSDATALLELRKEIEETAEEDMAAKEEEWELKSQEHENKIREMAGLSCVYITELDEHGLAREVHKKPCRKHKLKWEAKQMTINIHEHPLPKAETALKAVLFELTCPEAFAAYRDATWLILSSFAFPPQAALEDVPQLRSYSGLRNHANTTKSHVTLGSSTKSHLDSHYAKSGFPVTFRDVCRPFGLRLDYFDSAGRTWTRRQEQASFAHLFPMKLPRNSPWISFEEIGDNWPTSNRALATQTKCPVDVNVHEYIAWQGLIVGTHLRWPSLLREMGSTNLSFSTDSTWAIVSKLVLQAGPSSSADALRDVHSVLSDVLFCEKLTEQIEYRLEAIRRNWREPVQLDILMTMLFKIVDFSSNTRICTTATNLVFECRTITQDWCASLQSIEHGPESGPSVFAIWAAVLCKRTFYPVLQGNTTIPRKSFIEFIVASIALQNCLVGKFDKLPYNLRNAVLRDLTAAYNVRMRLEDTVRFDKEILAEALGFFWPIPEDCRKHPIPLQFDPGTWWVAMTLITQESAHYYVHYNFVHGTLLINGQQLGVLPQEYRRWPIVQELFGSQILDVLPSALPGMSLMIVKQMPYQHWIHLGFRNGKLVIRAVHHDAISNIRTTLELIPRLWFGNESLYDLPAALAFNCYHWLDLRTGILEIRQQDPWKSKKGNWRLNSTTRHATRNNGSALIDPNSELARKIAQNFHQFEYAHNITVYQPPRGSLRVELKRLELDFFVTSRGLLQCPQLGAVVAETRLQDVGTWHGLKSKLVVRSPRDQTRRSILLPVGDATYEREGSHVSISIRNTGAFLKFDVNGILGRIECPAEPILMFNRALWHASTSYFLPDALTKRTGVDEALQYLDSGAYLPWTMLSPRAYELLVSLARLSPQRVYYPTTLKVMQSVCWDSNLTATIQDERYRRAVERILERNANLAQFTQNKSVENTSLAIEGSTHLENRALSHRNMNYSRTDCTYKPRDARTDGPKQDNVARIAHLIFQWPDQVNNTSKLTELLEEMPIIGGYGHFFDKVQITDMLTVDLGIDWGALVKTALDHTRKDSFSLTFLFSLLAFNAEVNMDVLCAIVSFAFFQDLRAISFPRGTAYSHFVSYETPTVDQIMTAVGGAKLPYVAHDDTPAHQRMMRQLDHEKGSIKACKLFAESVCAQWAAPQLEVDRLAKVGGIVFSLEKAVELVVPVWESYTDNFSFSQHIEEVQSLLGRHFVDGKDPNAARLPIPSQPRRLYPFRLRGGDSPTLQEILGKDCRSLSSHVQPHVPQVLTKLPNGYQAKPKLLAPAAVRVCDVRKMPDVPSHVKELSRLISPYKLSSSMIHKRYGTELEHSVRALADHLAKPENHQEPFNPTKLSNDTFKAKEAFGTMLEIIHSTLLLGDARAKWLNAVGLWPKVTARTLLTELRTTSGTVFGAGVKEALIELGLAITKYQRLLRLEDAIQKQHQQQIADERENAGHTNWSPADYVDWLLLEIESNILIRPEQVDVAVATISPANHQNSVLQLLMGKGKTSCILPMVALVLANKNLFRIVVPRPLLLQSAQIMQAKLGGMLDREVLHVPFSRKTPTDKPLMQMYCKLHTHVQKKHGIVLALPEHILSFKLSGIQRLCDGKSDEAAMMIKAQAWLDRHARDVLDECDVSLAIRTQLIYPSGSQHTVDGHPLRWQTIQAILDLMASYLDDLSRKYPNSIEVVERAGYPLIYFLRTDVEEYLVKQMIQKICKGQTGILPIGAYPESDQMDIYHFLSQPQVNIEVSDRIARMFRDRHHLMDVAHHLRGLFVHRILLSTLKKRWNVQYGLHPTRDPIAVPYQAKGVPSPTAEWGHPDVAIILTCLSFYYEGLNMSQFKQAIEQLAKSDEPSIEYSLWVSEGVPEAFKNYNAINVEDSQQLRELHYHIRHKVVLLNFFLNSFVFPLHARQFSKKLSASGSDLVLYEPMAPSCATTGFSGTNDTRHQLPMTIKQNDLPQLAHTNAEVLAYLLEERNRRYIRMVDTHNKRLSEEGFLRKLLKPGSLREPHPRVRILIDAGAQILEHDNRSLVKAWLKEDHEAVAAVYFDEEHRAMVVYGKGAEMALVASPFAENLEECLVYIDESHCRGTDLKLPSNARAAVTLGPHLTKDALVQAAMRLRLLGKSQAVTFFSPPEVHQSILDLRKAAKASPFIPLSSVDVIRWLLDQSCNAIEQLEPLYFNQGINFLHRAQAKLEYPDYLDDTESRDAYLEVVRSKELQTLQQLYGPKHQQRSPAIKISTFAACLRGFVSDVLQRRKDFQDRGFAVHSSALEEVEQEREVEFEVESVREVQPPVHFKAFKVPKLHQDLENLATTGTMPASSDALQPAIYALQKTDLATKHATITAANAAARLLVSTQFTRTVSTNEPNDNFLRPCHWLLWNCSNQIGVLVSPEEANALIPILQCSYLEEPICHLLVYSAPITHRMLHFNNLDYYAIPPLPSKFKVPSWLKIELGVFAGRLYFDWNEYEEIMSYLGVQNLKTEIDDEKNTEALSSFATKPLTFLHEWLAVRRKGQDFEHTPMGFVTTGKPLSADHPFFTASKKEEDEETKFSTATKSNGHPVEVVDDDESDDGEDHAKEHLFQHEDDEEGHDVFHDAEEELGDEFDHQDNTFFQGGAYVQNEEEKVEEE